MRVLIPHISANIWHFHILKKAILISMLWFLNYSFNLHFPDDLWFWTFFTSLFALYIFFGEGFYSNTLPIFKEIFKCFLIIEVWEFFIWIIGTSPLLDVWFANFFPNVCWVLFLFCFLILSTVFWRGEVLNFNEVKFIIFFLLWIRSLVLKYSLPSVTKYACHFFSKSYIFTFYI